MRQFRIFALGENFDPDAFCRAADFVPGSVWRRGENKPSSLNACTSGPRPMSGLDIHIPAPEAPTFHQQEAAALAFILKNRDLLGRLARTPGVDVFTLALDYPIELSPGLLGIPITIAPSLLRLCLSIGLEPVVYLAFRYPVSPDDEKAD